MKKRFLGTSIVLMLFLLIIAVSSPAIPAAMIEPDARNYASINMPEIAPINQSEINETAVVEFRETPEPVTIFRAEVSETALPGPRYMAFGPSVIDISVSPVILLAIIVLIVLGIAAGYIWMHKKE